METSVITKITQDLLMLQQQRATGELVITHNNQTSPQWRLYFYLGRLIYATGGTHPVRRWYRAIRKHCSDSTVDWFTKAKATSDLWEMELLEQSVNQGYINASQARAIVQSIAQEVVFALVGQQTLNTQWNSSKQIPQQAAFLSIEQVLNESRQLWEQWLSCGLGYLQELLSQFSPDLAPVIRDAKQLEVRVSPIVYTSLTRLMQGKLTLWDVAIRMQRSLPTVLRSLLPLIRQGVIELREIPDLAVPVFRSTSMPVSIHSNNGLIACIDDSPIIGQALEQILKPCGYEVLTILNPLQGIANLLERKPNLIFLDLVMPNTNGYELCTFLRKTSAFQDTPIVILTGHDGVVDRVRAKLAGSSDFLSKPPESTKVLQVVQKHLGNHPTLEITNSSNLAIA
jgi:two-component system, chemotaxis family, response regulator PixG